MALQVAEEEQIATRDYKFLTPELEGLFSAASMVEQEEKAYVVTRTGERYILGRNLPGQRTGSKNWYDLLSEV